MGLLCPHGPVGPSCGAQASLAGSCVPAAVAGSWRSSLVKSSLWFQLRCGWSVCECTVFSSSLGQEVSGVLVCGAAAYTLFRGFRQFSSPRLCLLRDVSSVDWGRHLLDLQVSCWWSAFIWQTPDFALEPLAGLQGLLRFLDEWWGGLAMVLSAPSCVLWSLLWLGLRVRDALVG